MLFRCYLRANSIHWSLFAEQDYDLAIKRTSATAHPSAQAMIRQGILLHRLRKGNVGPPATLPALSQTFTIRYMTDMLVICSM